MSTRYSRREFLAASAMGAGLLATGRLGAATFKTTLHKAVILGKNGMNEETFKKLKDTGLEGFEAYTVPVEEAKRARELAEKAGLHIHSVMGGGSPAGLRAAQAYGADAVLAPVGGCSAKPIPEPWEFDIKFDESNGHLTQVVAGDNEKYKAYIEAHNRSMDGAREGIKKLIPIAEETKVAIALENVWNNWCVRPELYKWLVASFNSPWVKAYFDVGNHVKYLAPPEVWIREFGPLLAKVHIKDFKLNPDNHGGRFVHPRDGSINWPAVRRALDDVGYNGWLTIEDGGIPYPEFNKRLDLIIAGQ